MKRMVMMEDEDTTRPSVFQRLGQTSNTVCRYFAESGHCTYGDKCNFLHDFRQQMRTNMPNANKWNETAEDFPQGSAERVRLADTPSHQHKTHRAHRKSKKSPSTSSKLKSKVVNIVRSQSPKSESGELSPTNSLGIEFQDELALERKRQELQRELLLLDNPNASIADTEVEIQHSQAETAQISPAAASSSRPKKRKKKRHHSHHHHKAQKSKSPQHVTSPTTEKDRTAADSAEAKAMIAEYYKQKKKKKERRSKQSTALLHIEEEFLSEQPLKRPSSHQKPPPAQHQSAPSVKVTPKEEPASQQFWKKTKQRKFTEVAPQFKIKSPSPPPEETVKSVAEEVKPVEFKRSSTNRKSRWEADVSPKPKLSTEEETAPRERVVRDLSPAPKKVAQIQSKVKSVPRKPAPSMPTAKRTTRPTTKHIRARAVSSEDSSSDSDSTSSSESDDTDSSVSRGRRRPRYRDASLSPVSTDSREGHRDSTSPTPTKNRQSKTRLTSRSSPRQSGKSSEYSPRSSAPKKQSVVRKVTVSRSEKRDVSGSGKHLPKSIVKKYVDDRSKRDAHHVQTKGNVKHAQPIAGRGMQARAGRNDEWNGRQQNRPTQRTQSSKYVQGKFAREDQSKQYGVHVSPRFQQKSWDAQGKDSGRENRKFTPGSAEGRHTRGGVIQSVVKRTSDSKFPANRRDVQGAVRSLTPRSKEKSSSRQPRVFKFEREDAEEKVKRKDGENWTGDSRRKLSVPTARREVEGNAAAQDAQQDVRRHFREEPRQVNDQGKQSTGEEDRWQRKLDTGKKTGEEGTRKRKEDFRKEMSDRKRPEVQSDTVTEVRRKMENKGVQGGKVEETRQSKRNAETGWKGQTSTKDEDRRGDRRSVQEGRNVALGDDCNEEARVEQRKKSDQQKKGSGVGDNQKRRNELKVESRGREATDDTQRRSERTNAPHREEDKNCIVLDKSRTQQPIGQVSGGLKRKREDESRDVRGSPVKRRRENEVVQESRQSSEAYNNRRPRDDMQRVMGNSQNRRREAARQEESSNQEPIRRRRDFGREDEIKRDRHSAIRHSSAERSSRGSMERKTRPTHGIDDKESDSTNTDEPRKISASSERSVPKKVDEDTEKEERTKSRESNSRSKEGSHSPSERSERHSFSSLDAVSDEELDGLDVIDEASDDSHISPTAAPSSINSVPEESIEDLLSISNELKKVPLRDVNARKARSCLYCHNPQRFFLLNGAVVNALDKNLKGEVENFVSDYLEKNKEENSYWPLKSGFALLENHDSALAWNRRRRRAKFVGTVALNSHADVLARKDLILSHLLNVGAVSRKKVVGKEWKKKSKEALQYLQAQDNIFRSKVVAKDSKKGWWQDEFKKVTEGKFNYEEEEAYPDDNNGSWGDCENYYDNQEDVVEEDDTPTTNFVNHANVVNSQNNLLIETAAESAAEAGLSMENQMDTNNYQQDNNNNDPNNNVEDLELANNNN